VVLHPGGTDGGAGRRATILAVLVAAAGLLLLRPEQVETSPLPAATAPAERRAADAGWTTCHRLAVPALWRRASDSPDPPAPPWTPGVVQPCSADADPLATPTPSTTPPGAGGGPTPPALTPTATPRPEVGYVCSCSVWDDAVLPQLPSQSDTRAVEVGVKFRAEVAGYVTAIRFYKGPANSGTHVGSLWTRDGVLLASATFTNESATGWQQVSFAAPVPIAANTTYVLSYYAPAGGYAASEYFFVNGVRNPPLRLLQSGEDGGNGVFAYGVSRFPTDTYNQNNYSIDLVFTTS
jgi:hypothetical protein